ncbi:MAG: 50S ribosomal protein L9 [Spirochaetota bacterium]
MKVILNQDISNLGEEGEIKDVARGYARNFLIPKKLVMPYTREALSMLESRRETIEQRREEKRKAAMDIKTRLETEPLVIEMPAGERGRLFGSVTSTNIADALAAQGIDVERRRIDIPEKTIKTVGTTYVRVRLYGEQEAELRVDVTAVGGTGTGESTAAAGESAAQGSESAAQGSESAAQGSESAAQSSESAAEAGDEAETASAADGVDTSDEEE